MVKRQILENTKIGEYRFVVVEDHLGEHYFLRLGESLEKPEKLAFNQLNGIEGVETEPVKFYKEVDKKEPNNYIIAVNVSGKHHTDDFPEVRKKIGETLVSVLKEKGVEEEESKRLIQIMQELDES